MIWRTAAVAGALLAVAACDGNVRVAVQTSGDPASCNTFAAGSKRVS